MSEADAMNASNSPQDFAHSNSPFYVEASSSTSDLPQNEVMTTRRETECKLTLSEEIYGTLDDLLGANPGKSKKGGEKDIHIGHCTQNQAADTSFPAFRLFEAPCEFYQTETFSGEVTTFQNLPECSPHAEKAEVQSHRYKYAKVSSAEADLLEEENPLGTSPYRSKNLLAPDWAGRPPGSPPLTHCSGQTQTFLETPPLARSPASPAAPNPGPPQNFLCEVAVCSQGGQNSGEIPELCVVHPKEVPEEGAKGPQVVPAGMWSPAGLSWSGGASQDCRSPDTEQSLESFQPLEEDMALNEVLQKLRQTNQKQQTRIYNLQCSNRYLEKKVAELQRRTAKQQVFLDVINKLKENVEELIEAKYKVMLEKNDTEKTLQKVHKVLASTQGHLQECRHEKEALQLELKKVKTSYVHLQERYVTEIQQKNKTLSQCVERDETLSRKEEEVQQLQQLKGELEKATACALDLLKKEKETREQELLFLQEEFQRQEKENLAERQKLKSRLENLIAQVKNLQIVSENEKVKNTQLQEQIDRVRCENARLQQQVTRTKTPPRSPLPVPAKEPSQDVPGPVLEPPITQNAGTLRPHLLLGCSRRPGEEESPDAPDMQRAAQLASKIHSLLALLVGFLMCQPQSVTNPDTEPVKDGEKVSDIMLQKLESFHHKKKNLDKELLKHKDRITTFRELIANEKAFQDQVIEATDFDLGEASSASDIPDLLGAKLDKYHNLNEELDFLIAKLGNLLESKENHCNRLIAENDRCQRHLGDLINKVVSYEEIIECADQRLELSHSHIAHLEQRNKHLEDLIKRPRERARKLRPRTLEQQPKSTAAVGLADGRCGQSRSA